MLGPSLGQARDGAHAADGSTGATGSTVASDDPNNYTCAGHIQKGAAESGVTGTQVEYQFSCDGPITGYQIETEPHQIQYFDQAPVVALDGVPSVDRQLLLQRVRARACRSTAPASTIAAFEVITGQFVIAGKNLCTEPRVDPILTVTEATATATIGGTKTAPTATRHGDAVHLGPLRPRPPVGLQGRPLRRRHAARQPPAEGRAARSARERLEGLDAPGSPAGSSRSPAAAPRARPAPHRAAVAGARATRRRRARCGGASAPPAR